MANPKALAFKEKGNAAFKAGDYPTAIGHYTSAILADRNDLTFPLNRAAAYLKLGKYEDTERDCNTVLTLSSPKSNVKALFRRGQARVGMGKLLEAQKDFSDVLLQEPSNASAAEELKALSVLIQKERAKKSKSSTPASIHPSPSTPNDAQVKRRRVPIRIVGDTSTPAPSKNSSTSASTSSSTANANAKAKAKAGPATPTAPAPTPPKITPATTADVQSAPPPSPSSTGPAIDTLQAVSSRSLKSSQTPTQPQASSPSPAPTSAAPSSTTPPIPAASKPPPPISFKDAKHAREAKANPSLPKARVGGGIFRASGESTIFPSRGGEAPSSSSKTSPSPNPSPMDVDGDVDVETAPARPASVQAQAPVRSQAPPTTVNAPTKTTTPAATKPPSTLFELSKTWYALRDPWEKWAFFSMIPPAHLPTLCKTSLEPALLVSILDVFLTVLSSAPPNPNPEPESEPEATIDARKVAIRAYMDALAHIPRFSTLVLFLSRPEKDVARAVWAALGVPRPGGVWAGVA